MPNQPIRLRRPAIVTPAAANIVIAAMRPKTSAPVLDSLPSAPGLLTPGFSPGLFSPGLFSPGLFSPGFSPGRSGSVPSLLTRPLMALSSAARSAV